jgi:hypothetical protein
MLVMLITITMQFPMATIKKKRSVRGVMEVRVINLVTDRNIFYILIFF